MRAMIWRLAITAALLASSANAAELRLAFPGLRAGGQVNYAVYADEAAWTRRQGPVKAGSAAIGAEVVLQLPPGTYAIMAYHDRDANLALNSLPIGLPTEPYGFSNDSRGRFGPPGWRAARFTLGDGGARQTIRLR